MKQIIKDIAKTAKYALFLDAGFLGFGVLVILGREVLGRCPAFGTFVVVAGLDFGVVVVL